MVKKAGRETALSEGWCNLMGLKVNEIFYSIQGESSFAGLPCVFIRLTGCNLRCTYCDTRYAYEQGRNMPLRAVVDWVQSYRCPLVEVTGGEPLIQEDVPELVCRLVDLGFTVLLETNGSQDIRRIDRRCVRIVDVKCPSSGESAKNDLENLYRLTDNDELKFVIGDAQDYMYAKEMVNALPTSYSKKGTIHFSPVFDRMAPDELAKWILKDRLNVRLHLQLHKLIWPSAERGV